MWNKNEIAGQVDQARGKVKQAVGALIDDNKLKTEGHVDEAAGKIQTAVGEAKRKAGDALVELAEAVKN
jgi:uncharacterized protein YjbJ (UPF0337 family)